MLHGTQKIISYDGNLLKIRAGEIGFMPKGIYTITDLTAENDKFESVLFFIEEHVIQEFINQNQSFSKISPVQKPQFTNFKSSLILDSFFNSIPYLAKNYSNAPNGFVNIKLHEFLYLMLQSHKNLLVSNLKALSQPEKRNIRTFMEQNFDKPLKVEDYASLTGRSLSGFRRDFKWFYETTPNNWLKNRRLEKDYDLILHSEKTVSEIAFETGYENISYFIKEFKSKYQHTPKQIALQTARTV